jgi:hypothetical protein
LRSEKRTSMRLPSTVTIWMSRRPNTRLSAFAEARISPLPETPILGLRKPSIS